MYRIFISLLMVAVLTVIAPFQANAEEAVDRIYGDNRAETAVEISKEGWADGAETVILATGQEYADALSSSTLAYTLDAPILLTTFADRISDATLAELERLSPEQIYIVGGENAVDDSIKTELQELDYQVDRIHGNDRFETGIEIANKLLELHPEQAEFIVAKGMNFPDALSAASHAATSGMPILLTLEDRVPKAVEAFIKETEIEKSIVVGLKSAITDEVLEAFPNSERVGGKDRYRTAVALANYFESDMDHLYFATGENFADALTGSVLAAKNNAPILLTPKDRLLDSVIPSINEASTATIFGGDVAISDTVLEGISEVLRGVEEDPNTPDRIAELEKEAVRLVNIHREEHGLEPVEVDNRLTDLARLKSQDFIDHNYFAHESPTYGSPFEMLRMHGINYTAAGENIARGYLSAESVVDGWMNSEGHRNNILNPNYTHMGIGYAESNTAFWTQLLVRY